MAEGRRPLRPHELADSSSPSFVKSSPNIRTWSSLFVPSLTALSARTALCMSLTKWTVRWSP